MDKIEIKISTRTTRFYASPSFLEGIARLVDFCGSLNVYNSSGDPIKDDWEATASDWDVVGDDLREAIKICKATKNVEITDSIVQRARRELAEDQSMQELISLHG